MKQFALIAALALVAIFFFMQGRVYKKSFEFNGKTYSHEKEQRGGDVVNHFYTLNGEGVEVARDFVQVIEFGGKIPKAEWTRSLGALYGQYGLKPMKGNEHELIGSREIGGIFFRSYAAPITVKGEEAMAFYIIATDKGKAETSRQKAAMIEKIKQIQF